jgi:hypothetical protein
LQLDDSADAAKFASDLKEDAEVKLAPTREETSNTWALFTNILNTMVPVLVASSAALALTVVYE